MADSRPVEVEKSCGYCRKPVVSKKVKCANCDTNFHTSCAVKKSKKCCEMQKLEGEIQESNQMSTGRMPEADGMGSQDFTREENRLLKQIIKDKEVIINDKEYVIKLLQDKVCTLQKELEEKMGPNQIRLDRDNTKKGKYNNREKAHQQETVAGSAISSNLSTLEKYQLSLMESVINLDADTSGKKQEIDNKGEWQSAQRRNKSKQTGQSESRQSTSRGDGQENRNSTINRQNTENKTTHEDDNQDRGRNSNRFRNPYGKHRRPLFYGTSTEDSVKGLPRRMWFFISRLDPEMTDQDLRAILMKKCPNADIVVERQKVYNEYQSAFKVGVPTEFENQAKNANFWPKDSRVDKYHFFLARKKIPEMN